MLRFTAFVALLLPALPGAAAAQPVSELQARIESPQEEPGENGLGTLSVEELMDSLGVPGFSLAVFRDFRIHWAEGYGVRDVETGAPVDTETVFQAASISKPVAAMATLRAVQDGLFDLDDDINGILTSWRLDGEGMTERRPVTPLGLTSHTSGLGDGFGFPGYEPGEELPTLVQILEGHELSNVGPIFMEREPEVAYEYSGGGVTLMQLALADARGRPFDELMRDQVLGPLGMNRSTYEQPLPPAWDANAARAHGSEGESMGPKWHVYPEQAAAGLWTTATDLARFAIEVQRSVQGESNRVLDEAHARRMITPVGVGPFAVGFIVGKEGEGWYFEHSGGNWGFISNLVGHFSKGYGYAILTNSSSGGRLVGEIHDRIQRAYAWDAVAEPEPRGYRPPVEREAVEVDRELLARYAGTYATDGDTLDVRLEESGLVLRPGSGGEYELLAASETHFFLEGAGVTFTFRVGDDGRARAVVVHRGGRDEEYPRAGGSGAG